MPHSPTKTPNNHGRSPDDIYVRKGKVVLAVLALALAVAAALAGALRSILTIEFLVIVSVVAILAWALRSYFVRRELSRRVTWLVRPADEFNPSAEHIANFARQAQEARLAISASLLRPAAAIRVRLSSTGDGQMQYELSAPYSGRGVIEGSMYPKVELRRVDEVDPGSIGLTLDVETPAEARAALEADRLAREALAPVDEPGTDMVVFEQGEGSL